jgi:ubiquinone/menaquinone biosynthesis C-methylase UbiE
VNTKQEQEWKKFFCEGIYYQGWNPKIDTQKAEIEVRGVLNLLKPPPGSHILDWCGGYGRHSVILALRGYKMTLLDFAPNHIEMARQRAEQAGVNINLVCADFRETPPEIQADFAINLFTSGIGYLSEEDDLQALKSLHKALKPNALFLLETMHLFWLVNNFQPTAGDIYQNGMRAIEQREFDFWQNRIHSNFLWWKQGEEKQHQLNHRIYSARELSNLLRSAGFKPLRLYGGLEGNPLSFDSKRLVIVSQKI